MQGIINKLTNDGRAALFAHGSPLFTGGTASGESQIRRWLLENDLIEAIVGLPTDLFYNTGIATYIWLISKNKRPGRRGKVQLIDASNICHKLRKSLGDKKNEITPEDRLEITNLYLNFESNEQSKIYDNEDFMYREYTVMQPLQRSYAVTDERIENMLSKGSLSALYDESKVYELENSTEELTTKDQKKLDEYNANKPVYDEVISILKSNISDKKYLSKEPFEALVNDILGGTIDKKLNAKVVDGLSIMDKEAQIQRDKKGNILWDKETKDTELVPYKEKIDDYMEREVLPHVPDARAFFEGKDEESTFEMDLGEKTVKIGAEIPFTRYFYKYQQPTPSDELLKKFNKLEESITVEISKLVEAL